MVKTDGKSRLSTSDATEAESQKKITKVQHEKVPSFLSGVMGEAIAVQWLQRLGFKVNWHGGLTNVHDLQVSLGGKSWLVQVKTSQRDDGGIPWAKAGARALELESKALQNGHDGAFFVLIHMKKTGSHSFDIDKGVLKIKLPKKAFVTGLTAQQFADSVDKARIAYGQEKYLRNHKGHKVGDFKCSENIRFPISVHDHPWLHKFVDTL